MLTEIEKKALWLSAWMIHNANHLRPSRDGLKVGGHQASCASGGDPADRTGMDVLGLRTELLSSRTRVRFFMP